MCNVAKQPKWWHFWQLSFSIVLLHFILLALFVLLNLLLGDLEDPEMHGTGSAMPSNTFNQFIQTALIGISLLIFFTSPLLALIGFAIRFKGGKGRRTLTAYVALQLVIVLAILSMHFVDMYERWHNYQQIAPWQQSYFSMAVDMTVTMLILCAMLSVPLVLLIGRGAWLLIVRPKPDVDATGKYLNCASCGYDLRGTPGMTCSECGASAMANKSQEKQALQ